MKQNDITWAPLIPLIGGLPLGAELAFNKPPAAIYSYDGFQPNDSHYVNYMNNTRKNDAKYITIENDYNPGCSIDVICGTPPLKLAA